jgi:hypothetical protein
MLKKIKKMISSMVNKESIENADLREDYDQFSYQWIKGDNLSKVQHFKDIWSDGSKNYLVFTDGSRIALDLLDEYMMRVEKGFEETSLERKEIRIESSDINQKSSVKTREHKEISSKYASEHPIFSLLSKQKENWVDVDLKLSINLPPRSLWDVLLSSFDDAEEAILEYVTKDLDIEVVRQSLRESIKDIYKKQKNLSSLKNVRSQDNTPE